MSRLHYFSMESSALADEWTSIVENGDSVAVKSASAAWPDRGSYGMRVTVAGANKAYGSKDTGYTIPAGGSIYIGFWFRMPSYPSGTTIPLQLYAGANILTGVFLSSTGTLYLRLWNDAAGISNKGYSNEAMDDNRWHYVVVELQRAATNVSADGEGRVYVDGHEWLEVTGVDNYDRVGGSAITLRLGAVDWATDGWVGDFDEVKIATTYTQPYGPTPTTDYCEAARTVVLYRRDDSDSVEFADYCATELGIPRANLLPLLAATGVETLAGEAELQSRVTDDMDDWFALNTDAAGRCTCFIVGLDVPQFFTEGGDRHSVASRLTRYGQAFSSQTDNPFYGSSTRPTATTLAAQNMHLAVSIDADTLAHAKAIIDAAAVVEAVTIPDADYFASDDSDLRSSLAVQKLRILTHATKPENAAITIGDDITTMGGLSEAGTRACVCELATNAQTTLRSASTPMSTALISGGWASGYGFSKTGDSFDGEAFCDALREGWTFAEAALVATEHLDYTAVPVGSPFLTVAFRQAGYNIYQGGADTRSIDWANPIACSRPGESQVNISMNLQPDKTCVLAARAVSASGIEETNHHAIAFVEVDGEGQLSEAPLAAPCELTARLVSPNLARVGFSCYPSPGQRRPSLFEIFTDSGTGTIELQSPAATIEANSAQTDFSVTVEAPLLPCKFAARARLGEVSGPLTHAVTLHAPAEIDPPESL